MSLLKTVFHVVFVPVAVLAQAYGGGGGGSTTTAAAQSAPSAPPSTPGQVNIDVFYQGNFAFNPPNVNASNGTLVTFYVPSGSFPHSITQSSFANPCTYLVANSTTNASAGFDSGLTNGAQFTINITDDRQPIWFHCKFPMHCGMGMVGSINAPTTGNTFEAFQAKAKAIGPNNEVTEQDAGPKTGGVGGVATAGPTGGGSNGQIKTVASASAFLFSLTLGLTML